jgi:hypothetical protein
LPSAIGVSKISTEETTMRSTATTYRSRNHRCLRALVAAFLAAGAAAVPAVGQAAPPTLVAFINLRNTATVPPTIIPVGSAVTQLAGPAPSPNSANDGTFFMASVKVNLTGFTKACFTLDYEGTPVGWTLNIGDDSTNDGFGGASPGLSSSVAEVQILDEVMAMFSIALGPGVVDQLLTERLRLTDSAYKVCVADDLVTYGNPAGALNTANSKIGFQIPDTAPATSFSAAGNGNRDIFAGFNRVVNGTSRNGIGLSRVLITLE